MVADETSFVVRRIFYEEVAELVMPEVAARLDHVRRYGTSGSISGG